MAVPENHAADPLTLYPRGIFPCRQCAAELPMQGAEPLQAATCPACGASTLVPQKVDRFWLVEKLAVGGMSAVFKALHEQRPGRFFAVKLLPRDQRQNETLIGNLKREIATMREIGFHPCIVNVAGSGYEDGEYYMATDYVIGEGLDERIIRLGPLSETEALLMTMRMLAAETHIYGRGCLYRDLKPENIILNRYNGACLCDFGICMRLEDAARLDQGDQVQGSPLYMPPERLLAEGEDAHSEIYSLGLVLYHALTSQPYFNAKAVQTVAKLHVDAYTEAEQVEKMRDIKPDVAVVLKRMIRRAPAARYQRFFEVERDIFKILASRLYT